jgi:uncharacterized protein (TIGR00645 family)
MNKKILFLEKLVFGSRWLLYPMNIGLIVALIVYTVRFLVDDFHLIINGFTGHSEQVMLGVLGLVDILMIGNLLSMIILGSYQVFIKKIDVDTRENRPQWLEHVDSGILKVKVALSISGITLIQILKDFVNLEHLDWTLVVHRAIIHLVCLFSALILAVIWRVMHPGHSYGKHAELSSLPRLDQTSPAGHQEVQVRPERGPAYPRKEDRANRAV